MAIYKKVLGDIVKVAGYGDIADNLTTLSPVMSLSAKQGNVLDTNKAERLDISGIITTGTKNTTGSQIASGTYFYLNGELVKAKSDIAVNADYTLNTNYELATVGGVLTELNSKLTGNDLSITLSTGGGAVTNNSYGYIIGNLAIIHLSLYSNVTASTFDCVYNIGRVPVRSEQTTAINGVRFRLYYSSSIGWSITNLDTLSSGGYFEGDIIFRVA